MRDALSSAPPSGTVLQPIVAGVLSAVVGFAGAVAIVLAGYAALGATPQQSASGLFAVSLVMGLLGIGLSLWTRLPITVAWSTPGSALLIATGAPEGGYAVAVGAFIVAAVLIIIAGLWKPFSRAVSSIPVSLAAAMLAGVLLPICLAPVKAVAEAPTLALPIIVAWAIGYRFVRPYAVPVAVVVAAIVIATQTEIPASAFLHLWPEVTFIVPEFTLAAAIGIGVPLFIVTMASQNVPGLAVLSANGFKPDVPPIFVTTGLGSVVTAFMGGHSVNLAAITAALCASPEAHPDPGKRWIASASSGVFYVLLAFGAAFATAFVTASPPLLIQAVAGLALLGSVGGALASALSRDEDRIPAIATFLTTASGVSFLGIGAAFWGLVAGGALMVLLRAGRR